MSQRALEGEGPSEVFQIAELPMSDVGVVPAGTELARQASTGSAATPGAEPVDMVIVCHRRRAVRY